MKFNESRGQSNATAAATSWREECEHEKDKLASRNFNHSDQFAIPSLLEVLDSYKFGNVTRDIKDLIARQMKLVNSCFVSDHSLPDKVWELKRICDYKGAFEGNQPAPAPNVIDLEDEQEAESNLSKCFEPSAGPLVIIDSDDEDTQENTLFFI